MNTIIQATQTAESIPFTPTGSITATNVATAIIQASQLPTGGGGGGTASFVPVFLASGETFTLPSTSQAVFSYPITSEGDLDLSGILIEV